jgi:outer membrane biosynthesis protein TonB
MMDWLTLLKLGGGALGLLLVLHLIARSVNRSRAKAAASLKTNVQTVRTEKPVVAGRMPVTEKPAATISPAPLLAVPVPNNDFVPAPTEAPPLPAAAKPKPKTSAPAANPTRRPKRKPPERRPRPTFAPVTKAKPAVTRRPKPAKRIRRRKKTAVLPFAGGRRGPIQDQPRLQ